MYLRAVFDVVPNRCQFLQNPLLLITKEDLGIFSSYKRIKEYTTLGFVFIQTLLYAV
jgi:hypothetical protein